MADSPVKVDRPQRDFLFYAAKDLAMSEEADYGLMLWDGESQGTVNNILNLLERGKKVVVYLSPQKEFPTFKAPADADELLRRLDPEVAEALDKLRGRQRRRETAARLLRHVPNTRLTGEDLLRCGPFTPCRAP